MDMAFYFALLMVSALTVMGGLLLAHDREESLLMRYLPFLIAVGTGMLLVLCLTEFLPHSFASSSGQAASWIFAGLLLVLVSERYLAPLFRIGGKEHHCHHTGEEDHLHHPGALSPHAACTSIGCIIVCAFFDGLQLQAAFQIDPSTGWLVTLGLAPHTVPQGMLAAGMAVAAGMGAKAARISALVTGAAILAGALFALGLAHVFDFYAIALPLAAGVLLYLCLTHLLPAALQSRWGIVGLAIGGASMMLLAQLSGHTH